MKKAIKTSLVSIIITNYNKSAFIVKSVKSCINQRYKKKEIILIDDNSSDNSLTKIKNFKKKNKLNFSIFSNSKKKGKYATFNHIEAVKKGLSKAKGKYIFLLDSDDYFHKNKILKILNVFENNKKIKFILDSPILKFNNKEVKKSFSYKTLKNKWPKFPPTSCMCFEKKYLKSAIKKIELKKFPNLAIDFRLAVYYSLILKKFYIYKSHLTYYRQVDQSMDTKYIKYRSKAWWARRKEAFEFLNYILKKNKLPTNNSIDFHITKILNKILSL